MPKHSQPSRESHGQTSRKRSRPSGEAQPQTSREELLNLDYLVVAADQERALVQSLYEYRLAHKDFQGYYEHIRPRNTLSSEQINRFNSASKDIKRFWLEQEARELKNIILPGEKVLSSHQEKTILVHKVADKQEANNFRTRLHREISVSRHEIISFDLEEQVNTDTVVLALFGVPDGAVHIVDLRDKAPGNQELSTVSLKEIMGPELVSLFERKPIVVGQNVSVDCQKVELYPVRAVHVEHLSSALDRHLLPRGNVQEIIQRKGLGCFNLLIHGFHLKPIRSKSGRSGEELALREGLCGWPYKDNRRRVFYQLYNWPHNMRSRDAIRHTLYCFSDVVVPIDITYRYILQHLTREDTNFEDATIAGWTNLLLRPYWQPVLQDQEEKKNPFFEAVAGPSQDPPTPPAPEEEEYIVIDSTYDEPFVAPEPLTITVPLEQPERKETRKHERKTSKASKKSKDESQLSKQERKRIKEEERAKRKERYDLINQPARSRIARTKDKLITTVDVRCPEMPGELPYRSPLWEGFTGDPHSEQTPGTSLHILQLEMVFKELPPLFGVLRKVLRKITNIVLLDIDGPYNFSRLSDREKHLRFGKSKSIDLYMPSGYNEKWRERPIEERINREVELMRELRQIRFEDDEKKFEKVPADYTHSRECITGPYTDRRHCPSCGSPRHGRQGDRQCSLPRKRIYHDYAETRDQQLCAYPLCTRRLEHLTCACPILVQRCTFCKMRGHGDDLCPGRLEAAPATHEALRTLFEC